MHGQKRPLEEVEVIANELDWSDFQWGDQSLLMKQNNTEKLRIAPLKNYKYYPITQ